MNFDLWQLKTTPVASLCLELKALTNNISIQKV